MKILYVSNFRTIKGPETLIMAMPHLRGLDIELTMVSKGPLLDYCKRLAVKLDLNINFTGFISNEELAKLYKAADIIVFPYGSGVTLIEAMMHGKPIITYDRSWARGYVKDLVSAYFVYDRKPESFADAIRALYNDEDLREKLRKNALAKTKTMFWKDVADQVDESFRRASNVK